MDRDHLPNPIKRELRREARFGCCFCGHSIGQYHHIVPYSDCKTHDPANMMFVCLLCHDKITKRIVSILDQYEAKHSPFNQKNNSCSGLLLNKQNYVAVDVGGGVFLVGDFLSFTVDDKVIFEFHRNEMGFLDISGEIRNSNDEIVALLDRNEWICDSNDLWDVEVDWHKLTIREKFGKISFELDTNKKPMTLKANLFFGGSNFSFSNSGFSAHHGSWASSAGSSLENIGVVNTTFAIKSTGLQLLAAPDGGILISEPDPRRRLYRCVEIFKKRRGIGSVNL
ncbi:MAG: HNH endonuclease [Roseomonas sp.]|nr:HNH endonuclease [Roseomonas sp.]